MGTSFPIRYGILIFILIGIGCEKTSHFKRKPFNIEDKLIRISADSTSIGYIVNTSSAERLYSGKKSPYRSYALFYYNVPETTFDSMKFVFNGDSIEDSVFAISITQEWNESLITYRAKDSIFGDTFGIYAENGTTLSLNIPKDTFFSYIKDYGFALVNKHWQAYYSKESSTPPQLYLYGDSTIVYKPDKDAYIIGDTAETTRNYLDTLILETGMMSKVFFTLPLDSIFNISDSQNTIISASILLSARDSFPYSIECVSVVGETLRTVSTLSGIYPDKTAGINILSAINDSVFQLLLEPQSPISSPRQTSLRVDSFYLYFIYKSAPIGREGL